MFFIFPLLRIEYKVNKYFHPGFSPVQVILCLYLTGNSPVQVIDAPLNSPVLCFIILIPVCREEEAENLYQE
jgi:hypothetical protein